MTLPRLTPLRLAAIAALTGALALPAMAQQNLEKLKQFKVATTDLNIPVVPQTGRNADAIRNNLKNIKNPVLVTDGRYDLIDIPANSVLIAGQIPFAWLANPPRS